MTSAEYYSPYFISARTAEIVYNSEARNRKIEQHTINKFMLSGQPKEVGCRVRGILLGGPAWVRGVLCEGQNYDYPIKPPHAGPEHILQRVLVKYSVDGRTRKDWFYLRWGEVWFDGKPMPVITDSDEWLRDLILHRLVFAPLVTELRVPHASRYNPDLSPTCTYTENRLIYFPAFFEEEGDVECNPGRFARRAWSVRFLYLYGGVEQPVWYHEKTVIPAAGAHNLLIPDDKFHELLIPASPSVLLVFDIPFLPSSDAWILAPAQLTGRLRNLYVDDYGYPHPPFIDGPLSLCDGSS